LARTALLLLTSLASLATVLSALPALLALAALSGLSALLAELTALLTTLTVFLHIVCHEHSSDAHTRLHRAVCRFSLSDYLVAGELANGWEEKAVHSGVSRKRLCRADLTEMFNEQDLTEMLAVIGPLGPKSEQIQSSKINLSSNSP
jgi:hypothetical protein